MIKRLEKGTGFPAARHWTSSEKLSLGGPQDTDFRLFELFCCGSLFSISSRPMKAPHGCLHKFTEAAKLLSIR